MRALVIEDDLETATVLHSTLLRQGYEVNVAALSNCALAAASFYDRVIVKGVSLSPPDLPAFWLAINK